MHFPGLKSATDCFTQIRARINTCSKLKVPEAVKISERVAVGIFPVLVSSLLFQRLSQLFMLMSLAVLFLLMRPVQDQLFDLSPMERQWFVAVPVHALFIAWAGLLVYVGHEIQIGRSVGPMVLLVAVSIWPVYMGRRSYMQKIRKFKFRVKYTLIAVIVLIQQTLTLGRFFNG